MNAVLEPGKPDVEAILPDLVDIIRPYAKSYAGELNADTKIEKIGIDSFDFVEIIFNVEEKYGVDVDYNVNSTFSKLSTIGDFAAEISKLVAAKTGA
ncbi:acyl carrier protein [Methylopila sp. M107]|uniref:acyl carrier protein n=1 Tax=Methylopila sp. M107 TaxID=1101190 RepID=UPI0003A2190B|nr:acyl carrier protein [Methylopila sp. M107]